MAVGINILVGISFFLFILLASLSFDKKSGG